MISIARTTNRKRHPLTRRADGAALDRRRHVQRQQSFRRIKGYRQMPQLVDALLTATTFGLSVADGPPMAALEAFQR
jgi:hypothetical protein